MAIMQNKIQLYNCTILYTCFIQCRTTTTTQKTYKIIVVRKSSAQGAQFKQVPLLQEEVWTPQAHGKTSQWRWQGHAKAWASVSALGWSQSVVHHVKIAKPPLPARFDYILLVRSERCRIALEKFHIRESHTCSNLTNVKTGAPMWDLSKNVGLQ